MKKRFFYMTAILLSILFMAGCGKKVSTYNYNVDDIKHCDNLYIKKTVYYEDRVEIYFNSRDLENISFYCESLGNWSKKENKNNKLILYSDKPENITALSAHTNWYEVYFRYLDSDKYATIWCYWADDLGWDEYKGDKEKYYTPEEQRQQAQNAYEAAERAKERAAQSNEIYENILKGMWISDDGDYFDLTESDGKRTFLYYDAREDMYTECPGISYSQPTNEENVITAFESPYGWGAYYEFSFEMSEDKKSFKYEEKNFYLADEEVWSGIDVRYVHPVSVLFNNAEIWNADECRYAVTDLDMDGYPEIIVSGFSIEDNAPFTAIYETTEDGGVEKINDKNLLNTDIAPAPLTLYKVEESPSLKLGNKYQDEYDYLVFGEYDNGEGRVLTQYYLMSIQINTVVLEKVCSMESSENESETKYFNDKGEEITSTNYYGILGGVKGEAGYTASFGWFDEINIANMAKSFSVFYESMNYEDEEE